jgi:DNA-binding response OmpR family regulator
MAAPEKPAKKTEAKEVKKEVLVVDDDRDILASIQETLIEMGMDVRVTGNGNTAVEMIQNKIPDLLILDQMLPGRSGFLVMEKVRVIRKEKGGIPPVIMITANPGTRHKVYAQTLGVDAYINKPFRMEKLTTAVTELLAKYDKSGAAAKPDKPAKPQ